MNKTGDFWPGEEILPEIGISGLQLPVLTHPLCAGEAANTSPPSPRLHFGLHWGFNTEQGIGGLSCPHSPGSLSQISAPSNTKQVWDAD